MPASQRIKVPGVLFLYEDLLKPNASTLKDNIDAICHGSRHQWFPVNLLFGLPPLLEQYEFAACVMHYTLSPSCGWADDQLRQYLADGTNTYKVVIFQDEFWYFAERQRMLNDLRVDCLYSRHKPKHVRDVYPQARTIQAYQYYLAGYVSDDLIARANKAFVPFHQRTYDVGYRGRRVPYYLGRASQEKGDIADRFGELVAGQGLRLNLSAAENERLYGQSWDHFVANCRAMLGVEGGVSVIDLEGRFQRAYHELLRTCPNATFQQFLAHVGPEFDALEDRIDYRSVTPRHFEAAAFRTLQILFEGQYEGILQPHVHYVPLRKDYSNINDVLKVLRDDVAVERITDRAYQDLIASRKYSYQTFLDELDNRLASVAPMNRVDDILVHQVQNIITEYEQARSRIYLFEEMHRPLFNSGGPLPFRVRLASAIVHDHRRVVNRRRPATSAIRRACRRVLDRDLWHQVGGWIGRPVPCHPGTSIEGENRRSLVERALTWPARCWRFGRIIGWAIWNRVMGGVVGR